MARADILSKLYAKRGSALEFNYEALTAPPIYSMINPHDLDYMYKIVTSIKYTGNIDYKEQEIKKVMEYHGFKRFASGTHRVVYRHLENQRIVAKISLNKSSLGDNPKELRNQHFIKPFCCKCFEVQHYGLIGLFERVAPFQSREEFASVAGDIFDFLNTKIDGQYVVDDIGTDSFMNYGIRMVGPQNDVPFGPVLVDYVEIYPIDGNKLYCNKIDMRTGLLCGGAIDRDDGWNTLYCRKCGCTYSARDLQRLDESGQIYSITEEGGKAVDIFLFDSEGKVERVVRTVAASDVIDPPKHGINIAYGASFRKTPKNASMPKLPKGYQYVENGRPKKTSNGDDGFGVAPNTKNMYYSKNGGINIFRAAGYEPKEPIDDSIIEIFEYGTNRRYKLTDAPWYKKGENTGEETPEEEPKQEESTEEPKVEPAEEKPVGPVILGNIYDTKEEETSETEEEDQSDEEVAEAFNSFGQYATNTATTPSQVAQPVYDTGSKFIPEYSAAYSKDMGNSTSLQDGDYVNPWGDCNVVTECSDEEVKYNGFTYAADTTDDEESNEEDVSTDESLESTTVQTTSEDITEKDSDDAEGQNEDLAATAQETVPTDEDSADGHEEFVEYPAENTNESIDTSNTSDSENVTNDTVSNNVDRAGEVDYDTDTGYIGNTKVFEPDGKGGITFCGPFAGINDLQGIHATGPGISDADSDSAEEDYSAENELGGEPVEDEDADIYIDPREIVANIAANSIRNQNPFIGND